MSGVQEAAGPAAQDLLAETIVDERADMVQISEPMVKLKIGWAVCRLREQLSLKRCFGCLEFRHIAAKHTGDCDKSKMWKRRPHIQAVQS